MAYNRNHARALCTDNEYKLFTASLSDEITGHTPARLQSKIERARKLRDKYRDLIKRQRLANRARTGSKKGNRVDSNARTGDKEKLFAEVLGRLEARAEKLDAAAKRKADRAALAVIAATKKKPTTKRPTVPGSGKSGPARKARGTGFTSESARSSAQDKMARDNRSGSRKGMATAAGKRSQARRDNRR